MNNCGDQSDEEDCEYEEDSGSQPACNFTVEFECVGDLRQKCISLDKVCDGEHDCDVSESF